jgi:hypothetical protein
VWHDPVSGCMYAATGLTALCGPWRQLKRRAAEKVWLGTARSAELGPEVVIGCRSAGWRSAGHPNHAVQRTVTARLLRASSPVGGCAVPAADGERWPDWMNGGTA